MNTTNLIETDNLTRQYGNVRCVNSIRMRVPRGAVYGFLGPNGAGKSTTLKMILGLVRFPDRIAQLLRPPDRRGKSAYPADPEGLS